MEQIKAEDILEHLPGNYYIIRLDTKEIVQTNNKNISPGSGKCFHALFDNKSCCLEKNGKCICEQLIENQKKNEFILEKGEGQAKEFYKARCTQLEENLVLVNYIDVTEEHRIKKELKINSKRLERAEHLVDFGYWEFNIDDQLMLSSKGAKEIYGVDKTENPLDEIFKIPLPEYRKMLDERLKQLVENGAPYNVKFRIKRPNDGEIRFVHSIAEYREDKRMVFGVISDITEKVKSENALEESLIDLKLAQRIAKVGNWKYNPENHKLVWSEELYTIFNCNPESGPLSISAHEQYFSEEDFMEFRNLTLRAVKSGIPFELQAKIFLPDKTEKWLEVLCKPAQKAGPNGHYLRGTIQDITFSKNVEEELNNTNKLLRTVIDLIPDSIYMKDAGFRKLVANTGDAKHCGVNDVNEIIGKTDHELYPKEIADDYLQDDKKVIEQGEEIINREEILPDGENKRWVLTTKVPLKNDKNEIIGLVGIGRDITKLREQESQRRLFQQTIEQSPLSVMITNKHGKIKYINAGFSKITGYTKDEVTGKTPKILQSGKHDRSFYSQLWKTIKAGKNWHGELQNKKKDGTFYWESAVIAPVMDEKNEISHFVSVNEDITEKKQMIKDLEIAKDKAEESDKLKSLFLANMSHEIRTPLNGILGFSNVICNGAVEEQDKLKYYGTIIDNCGQRLVTVIDDIIDISMIQSNQLKIERETFKLNELLQEIFVLYKSQKAEQLSNLSFKVKLCENQKHQQLYSDKNRLFQVLKNLLDNAFKFTNEGHINFGCLESNDEELILFVEDTGIGIEKSKSKVIFESFRQAEEGNSRKYDGSGLGLAITSGILERLGGKVWIQSEVGKGSTFFVSVPREAKHVTKAIHSENRVSEPVNGNGHSKKRILSFEDDNASVEYLKSVANSMGCEIVNFMQAGDGIEFLKKNPVDLILMDVQLPQMNGYEATRQIKNEFPDIPVIIQTAYVMKGDKEKALEAGCDDYLAKPVRLKVLREKIREYLKN